METQQAADSGITWWFKRMVRVSSLLLNSILLNITLESYVTLPLERRCPNRMPIMHLEFLQNTSLPGAWQPQGRSHEMRLTSPAPSGGPLSLEAPVLNS